VPAGVLPVRNAEAELGCRLTASTLLEASYCRDTWQVNPSNPAFVRPGGDAFAVPLTQRFDAMAFRARQGLPTSA